MSIQERLMADLAAAMKSGDTARREAIRMLRAAIKNEEIELGHPLSDQEAQRVVSRLVKRHRESIEQFKRGNRSDLVAYEEAQLAALQPYLPQLMERADIEREVRTVLSELQPGADVSHGQVMATLARRLRGKADMKQVDQIVRELLGTGSRPS